MVSLSDRQRRALAIAPKLTASVSFFSTIFIIVDVARSKTKRENTYHHFLVALSLCDMIIAIGTFLSTWPIPADMSEGVWGARGTQQTCVAQGFFLQLSIMAPLYNLSLSLYYLLMCAFGWSERRIKRIRLWVHGTILSFGIGTSVAGLVLNLFNNASLWCWIASSPMGCVESAISPDGITTCVRGNNATSVYRWAFFYIPLWVAIILATASMLWTWCALKEKGKQTENVLRSSFSYNDSNRLIEKLQRKERERNVLAQCLFFLGAFYLTWVCPTALRVVQSTSDAPPSFGLLLSVGLTLPFQGFFNFLVYLRPRYQRFKQTNARRSVMSMDGLRSMFWDGDANAEEDDYNVAPAADDDLGGSSRRESQRGSWKERFRDIRDIPGSSSKKSGSSASGGSYLSFTRRSKQSASRSSAGSHPPPNLNRSVRFSNISQVDNASKASLTGTGMEGSTYEEADAASQPQHLASPASPST